MLSFLSRYFDHSFVDLHKVQGMRGVYIASQLTAGRVGHRHITTQISFDKGGMWQPIAAPEVDNTGVPINCSLVCQYVIVSSSPVVKYV